VFVSFILIENGTKRNLILDCSTITEPAPGTKRATHLGFQIRSWSGSFFKKSLFFNARRRQDVRASIAAGGRDINDRHCQCDGGLPTGPGQFKWPTSWKGDPARLGRVLRDFGSGHPAGAPSKVYLLEARPRRFYNQLINL
jgi:hypothetical protein